MKVTEARDCIAAIKHDFATGRVEAGRRKASELLGWSGDIMRAPKLEILGALLDVEQQLTEMGL